MPTAYTILFLLLILVAAATWIIPAGSYDYVDGVPVAVLDLLAGFPRADTLHIGLLLVDGTRRRQGIGKLLVTALARQAEAEGFRRLRLGVVAGNCGGRAFWTAMGFHTVDTVESCPAPDRRWTVEIMERPL